ncbi:MAG: hypothetical protein IKE56_00470 [Lachnospiraceae bacterium]|nr:hypothetical protein [Lachnospiraceae bacterium]
MIENSEKFSADGYIIDQDLFDKSYPYRTMPSAWNGCGWIAAYNLRHALGDPVYFDDVRAEMDAMHRLRIPGPTLMRVMRAYLDRYVPGWKETAGRDEAAREAAGSTAGIFRYTEGTVPHFITFVRQEDGCFRFFNVNDDLIDACMPMDRFVREHFLGGTVIALTVAQSDNSAKA